MNIIQVLLALIVLTELVTSDPLKMVFDVEYDKSKHNYNLVINKKTKTDEKIRKLINKKSLETYHLLVRNFNKLINQLKRTITKRKGITDNIELKGELGNLEEKFKSTLKKSKQQAKTDVVKAYQKALKIYTSTADRFKQNYNEFKLSEESNRDNLQVKAIDQLDLDYKKQHRLGKD